MKVLNGRILTAAATALVAGLALAGPLDPPAGPVAPTMKTLDQVEARIPITSVPTTITQPGSYYLTGNLSAVGTNGILIANNDVTIDLNGFRLSGNNTGSFVGVMAMVDGLRNITIRNGVVANFGGNGIDLATFDTYDSVIEDVSVSGNGLRGMFVEYRARATRCRAVANGNIGIDMGVNAILVDCVSAQNGGRGIDVGPTSVLSACITQGNLDSGIYASYGSILTRCASSSDHGAGIYVGPGCTLEACNSQFATIHGFVVGTNSTVTGCMSRSATLTGFVLGMGSTISNCTAAANGADGFNLPAMCVATGNSAWGNSNAGCAGIRVGGAGCRVDSNHVTGNHFGIKTTVADVLVVRNSARDNSGGNYSFDVPGETAQIVTNPGPNFVQTNPWANFAY